MFVDTQIMSHCSKQKSCDNHADLWPPLVFMFFINNYIKLIWLFSKSNWKYKTIRMWAETRGHTFQMIRKRSCKQAFIQSSSRSLKDFWCCFVVVETSVVIWKWFNLFGLFCRESVGGNKSTSRAEAKKTKVLMLMNSRPWTPPPQTTTTQFTASPCNSRTAAKRPHFPQKCPHIKNNSLFAFLNVLSSLSKYFILSFHKVS